jgi:hypothetical protein
MRRQLTAYVRKRPSVAGFVGGVVAFLSVTSLAGLATWNRLQALNSPIRDVGTLTDTLFPSVWTALGWTVFGLHSVPVRPVSSGTESDAVTVLLFWLYSGVEFPATLPLDPADGARSVRNVARVALGDLYFAVLALLPMLALVAVGTLLGRRFARGYWDGAFLGALSVLGYLPCVLLVGVLTRADIAAYGYKATVGVDLAFAAAVAGVVYPVVFGGLGGLVSQGALAVLWRVVVRVVRNHVLLDSQ